MECVKKQDAVKHENSPNCVVYEYPMKNSEMNIGVAEINQRYTLNLINKSKINESDQYYEFCRNQDGDLH